MTILCNTVILLFLVFQNAVTLPISQNRLQFTFPPLQTVIETILVTTDSQIDVEFQEAFCNGKNFTIYDNNVFIATVPEFEPRFCGINTSSYTPIVSPLFVRYNYLMSSGYHNLTVVIRDVPLANGQASLRITFKPQGPITKWQVISASRKTIP